MKAMLTTILFLGLVSLGLAEDSSNTVGTASVKILSSHPVLAAATWTDSVAVAQGSIRSYSNKFYMAINADTTGATPPTHDVGDVSDDTVIWRHIDPGIRKVAIISVSTNNPNAIVWLGIGQTAVPLTGIELHAGSVLAVYDSDRIFQEAIYAISSHAGTIVPTSEQALEK